MEPVASQSETPQHRPFWQPWGAWGCLWRTILFLLGFILLVVFFSLLTKGCHNMMDQDYEWGDSIVWNDTTSEDDFWRDLPDDLKDTSLVRDWIDSIPGVEELPDPDDNFIPPVDTTQIITDPEDSLTQIIGNQIVVFFNSEDVTKLKADMVEFAQRFKKLYPDEAYQVIYYQPTIGSMLLEVPTDKRVEVIQTLREKTKNIDCVIAPNEVLQQAMTPSDPDFSKPSYDEYYRLIQAYDAWDITQGDPNVKVAIVDTYFDLTHPEIGERYVDRINIFTKTRDVLPPRRQPRNGNEAGAYCHGTHVAGIAIGGVDNNLACSGIAPKCTWIPVSIGDCMSSFGLIEGILYSIYHGADVVNFSIGPSWDKDEIKRLQNHLDEQISLARNTNLGGEALWNYVLKIAESHKCVLVTASGNDNLLAGMGSQYRNEMMVKVEAVDGKGQKADFSNFGFIPQKQVDYSTVAAPGVKIWSATDRRLIPFWESPPIQKQTGWKTDEKNGLQEMDGTSMAAPVVTGAVALLKSKNKNLTIDQVVKILRMTGKQTDTKNPIGPTIQIRDALDAVGGDLANFDDLMSDHDKIIGKWKSTKALALEQNGQQTDETWFYFIFTSATSGKLEYHAINSKRIYSADVSVKWDKSSITINQLSDAVAADGDKVNADYFVCTPNKDRLLEASTRRNGKERFKFMLEKVN